VTWRSTWASSGPAAKGTPEQNGTFGLATITKDHVTVTKGQLQHDQPLVEVALCSQRLPVRDGIREPLPCSGPY
jgi:hypothetical protein